MFYYEEASQTLNKGQSCLTSNIQWNTVRPLLTYYEHFQTKFLFKFLSKNYKKSCTYHVAELLLRY